MQIGLGLVLVTTIGYLYARFTVYCSLYKKPLMHVVHSRITKV